MGTSDVPSKPDFEVGARYLRKELHDEFAGQRQYGISTPSAESFIFVFTDPQTEEHGYSDRFLSNGLFIYSGEGRVGDMTMDGGNERIRDHAENGDNLHVFEVVGESNGADVVAYDGEYEYVDHYWEEAPDDERNMRDAIRFKLAPVGGTEADVSEDDLDEASEGELFRLAKKAGSSGDGGGGTTPSGGSGSGSGTTRNEVVREFALQMADGVCQGCGEDAPFYTENDEPFLEVHHLHRVSDGGLDDPENVIAICPNCHREVHYGRNGERLNQGLIEKADTRNQKFS